MINFNLQDTLTKGARTGSSVELQSVELTDLISHIKADEVVVRNLKKGGTIAQVRNSTTNTWFSINFGKTVPVPETDEEFNQILNDEDILIFTGMEDKEGNERATPWFSFGKLGTITEPVIRMSVADLFKSKEVKTSNSLIG